MKSENCSFDEHAVLHELKHHLPAQAPLKDFIHHNTLHAFQYLKFFDAIREASVKLGYRVSLSLNEYRKLLKEGRIHEDVLERILVEQKGSTHAQAWRHKLVDAIYGDLPSPRIGALRAHWKKEFQVDLDSMVHPLLFRILCSYLDQGIAIWNFPVCHKGFLAALRSMERSSYVSFFRGKRARNLLLHGNLTIKGLLKIVLGDETLFRQYLFDQQFAHQGWSGMVKTIEDQPHTLLDHRKITLHDLIVFELLLEIDALDQHFRSAWSPLTNKLKQKPVDLFQPVDNTELFEVLRLWQLAFEWTYYDEVLAGLRTVHGNSAEPAAKTFQALFCIDDRECSFRRHLERENRACETFGTPGFFGAEFYFQPDHGKFYTKLCPAPVEPGFLIKEVGVRRKNEKDAHFTKHTHGLFRGWLISQTLGFWSAFKLFVNIFRPSMGPATATSLKHMEKEAHLTIENRNPKRRESNLQIGFNIEEMAVRVEHLLKSIGLIKDFAPLVYIIGHGSSSVNNPHYAAYDCGACSGRAGSVNARVICHMANHAQVRELLVQKGITIPHETQFVSGLHDTTRDEVIFFDEAELTAANRERHLRHKAVFATALDHNAKERSRRFMSVDTHLPPEEVHELVKLRSVSLFEPRPELNHATNALCVVGRRNLTRHLFLDRRAFLNSYNYELDLDGTRLFDVMKPLGPVCGGINLEYYFSRVDNQKLGAGTKLPHNVMGLIGVANGIDGDLRPGLPSQMIEVHDPVRLLMIVEHFPAVVLHTIQRTPEVYEWYHNEWIHLVAIHPVTGDFFVFREGALHPYQPLLPGVAFADPAPIIEKEKGNIQVLAIPH